MVTLVGRLCADPVLRHTKSGKAVTTIRLAVNAPDSESSFHSVVVWTRTAEIVCEYMRKGRSVEITGRTQQRSYKSADGTERKVTEIVASRVRFISGRDASQSATSEKEVA
jgi:single-strand DNA-binding protein